MIFYFFKGVIMKCAGTDATYTWNMYHEKSMIADHVADLIIGSLEGSDPAVSIELSQIRGSLEGWTAQSAVSGVALNKQEWLPFILKEKISLSHDVRRFRFALPAGKSLGVPTGQHVMLKHTTDDGKLVIRNYTPTTSDKDNLDHFDLCIKVYPPSPPRFPEGGKMSQHLDSLRIGDEVLMKGPSVSNAMY